MTPELQAILDNQWFITTRLHLEVESFYLFAKIFLDRVAQFMEVYFGRVRGGSMASHDGLAKCFDKVVAVHCLRDTSTFAALLPALKQRVSDFRDYQIAHERNPRTVRMTVWDSSKEPRMALTRLYPRPDEGAQQETESIESLMALLDQYNDCLMQLVTSNRDRSRFHQHEK